MTEEKNKRFVRLMPNINCDCNDSNEQENRYQVSIELPGTTKEDVKLKVIKSGLRLNAIKDENTEYVSELKFVCDVKPEEVKANYNDGLLIVDIPFSCPDPFKDVEPVKLS